MRYLKKKKPFTLLQKKGGTVFSLKT